MLHSVYTNGIGVWNCAWVSNMPHIHSNRFSAVDLHNKYNSMRSLSTNVFSIALSLRRKHNGEKG